MRLYEIIKEPVARLPRKPSNEALVKAEQAGFDTAKLWFHGTRKRFDGFQLPRERGIDELGPGIYLTSVKWLANTWARERGFIAICVARKGPLFDLDTLWNDEKKMMVLLRKGYIQYSVDRDGQGSAKDAAYVFKSEWERNGSRLVNRCLAGLGYVGAFKKDSQIPGQVVIFKPADVMIVARQGGQRWMTDDD